MARRGDKATSAIERRVAAVDWLAVAAALDERGFATVPELLAPAQCRALAGLYDDGEQFRSRVVMQRHAFGRGKYQYFAYPLPPPVEQLRRVIYPLLAPVADRWNEHLRRDQRFPPTLDGYLAQCHEAGQTRPTPLMLKYGAGDYNRLHQDRYGAVAFPLQATVFLSRKDEDFAGGEFLLVEQRPREQSRGTALAPEQGQALIFPTQYRPVQGKRGYLRAGMRHGVSTVTCGTRHTLGVIFHDAE